MSKLFAVLLLLSGLLLTAPAVRAQTPSSPVRYEYCEVRVAGSDVYADFGYGTEKLGGGSLSKLEVGKLQVFATPISALNYMGSLGWELIQVYQNTVSTAERHTTSGDRFYVMRRPRSATGVTVTKP